ncbi:YceI family protein [Roseivirga sp. E12]|uniref:YceI family protein n=1 Tax=Roseivirga sp. E12 TaxID=2819237 RepID=UPI001ABCAA21|nr:YceI family protein [Roseivirga sp. E12]MBO3700320.1 YceI family protein [Roseivirga sp. E12]
MKKQIITLVILFLGPFLTNGQIKELPLNNPESAISFSVGFAGGITRIEGRFDKFSGIIGYKSPNDLTSLYANVSIRVSSLNTGDNERDADLQGPGYFNAAEFPEITFKSERVEQRAGQLVMIGTFTMVGKTVQLEIPFERTHPEPLAWVFGEPRIAVRGQVNINRLEFGIPKRGWDNALPSLGSMALSKNVRVSLSIMGMGEGISGMMVAIANNEGAASAIQKYKSLEREYGEDENTYSFGGRTIVNVTLQLTRAGKHSEAIKIGQFGIQIDPESFLTHYALAGAYEANGDKAKAIEEYNKVLALNPHFTRAQEALDKLKK